MLLVKEDGSETTYMVFENPGFISELQITQNRNSVSATKVRLCVAQPDTEYIFWLRRAKHAGGRNAEADSKRGKGREEDGGGGVLAKGGDGGGATAERRAERKSQGGSRLPNLKYYMKHSP